MVSSTSVLYKYLVYGPVTFIKNVPAHYIARYLLKTTEKVFIVDNNVV